ncbi:MAG: hypothetical protein H6739_08125 [Alphaproteobacteria bacterium]|nr:hypothetical protein [Alphaproteobacteria bacterium]
MTRLFDHLLTLLPARKDARTALRSGKVAVRGVPTADGGRLVDPAEVSVNPRAPRITPGRDLAVVFRDDHFAVVYKPAGMLAVPAPGRNQEPDVIGVAARILGRAMPVHRLDEQTSGLMLVARTERARAALIEQLTAHRIERRYLALVRHQFPAKPLRIETMLLRNRGDGLRGSVDAHPALEARRPPHQRPVVAITHARRVELLPRDVSLVECRLETGRTHQVRIHLAERGFPVLGEPLYAPRRVRLAAPRLALHSSVLGLEHPATGQALRWDAPLDDTLEILRRQLLDSGKADDEGTSEKEG